MSRTSQEIGGSGGCVASYGKTRKPVPERRVGVTGRQARYRPARRLNPALLALLCLPQHLQAQQFTSLPSNPKLATQSDETPIPLLITNNCPETIWPGIGTQAGIGPGTGGFELGPTFSVQLFVGPTWQGRVWGRTNCSFNAAGTGPSNLNGINGNGAACSTGDCFGVVNCAFSVSSHTLKSNGAAHRDSCFKKRKRGKKDKWLD